MCFLRTLVGLVLLWLGGALVDTGWGGHRLWMGWGALLLGVRLIPWRRLGRLHLD